MEAEACTCGAAGSNFFITGNIFIKYCYTGILCRRHHIVALLVELARRPFAEWRLK